ncbi:MULTISPECIES: ABC transporter ATP-binding protein [Treponema]|uniref:Phosphonate-transporting ATPase n=1 Tax=Treponema succinifaciens (strain ATCC 33096 / DSM 2489 / 6091) TaxID=869209 RepID=F2NSP8_TRES6|nr:MULTISPECIES: ABC transporter ATP-binding protein [Treponema]AEB14286.1 Phosphonate-transporting ATPase [Treponema succinifaciens DSM 2489]MCI6912837.1 ABC transporter ATP-binding protein [Treponema succinifaciens]MDD6961693.1 ABC transporter ATP-binding protein [Treponema succinifaciens]MDY2616105.1 ABC transporter ATP-binding protein [Treponema succinifaciens]MDY5117705.1 ABC transporter ATP-binding protein [Treponema succinifaciens]
MNLIELKDISKNYKMDKVIVKAVDKASFSIKKGEFAAISGSSGSGKSTLLNIIGLIDLPTSGSLLLNGNDIYAQTKLSADTKLSAVLDKKLTVLRRKNLGFIFQTFNLIPVLNVRENVELPLTLGSSFATETMGKKELDEWIDFLIETVGLSAWKNHKPSELSGGQRQRVAIARALATKAPVILADEPTANLDSKNGDQILELMKTLNKELETTFIFSTHDAKIVNMADHVIKISDGKIISA